ncbi:outer membrane protein [Yunchengibacter salinarum]|uniref:outer membrane protein n=1 Tax=Yunchengibacter salinarum TaxID=3133399 RepID=UPI0035B64CDF
MQRLTPTLVTRTLAGLVALFGAGTAAMAEDRDEGLYLSGFGGLSFQSDQTSTLAGDVTIGQRLDADFKTGFVVGGAVGYRMPERFDGLRLELEVSYRENSLDDVRAVELPVTGVSGDNSSLGVLVNAIYDFEHVSDSFTPYVGLGAGLGGVESDAILQDGTATTPFGGTTKTEFLWQAIGGVSVPVSDRFEWFVEGRFYDAPGVDFDLAGGGRFNSEFSTWQTQTGLRFSF